MSNKQISLIKSYLKPNYIMLEYGAGGSTITFSKLVKKYYSIEHDVIWYKRIKNLAKKENINNIKMFCVIPNDNYYKIGYVERWQFEDYVNKINYLDIPMFNVILIDGRARPHCAIECFKYINKDSLVFIHDYFERESYHWVEDYYDIVDKLLDNKTLVVLKKK